MPGMPADANVVVLFRAGPPKIHGILPSTCALSGKRAMSSTMCKIMAPGRENGVSVPLTGNSSGSVILASNCGQVEAVGSPFARPCAHAPA